jgi:hypothetical protein
MIGDPVAGRSPNGSKGSMGARLELPMDRGAFVAYDPRRARGAGGPGG